ncbi:diguanylate cyclase [Kineosporia babensis]|nr:diguanylate cyclase [Kineosporia babensis]
MPFDVPGFVNLGELGSGAGSTVFRVRRAGVEDGHEYALKWLDKPFEATTGEHEIPPSMVELRREAAMLTAVDHPGLPRVYDVGQAQRRPYLVMELMRGTSLSDRLDQAQGPMPAEQVAELTLDLIEPLAAVHARGLVHRDLKPQNVMVLADGQARLIDFGLTVRGGEDEGQEETPLAVGTLAYSAPEQSGMLKRPVDNRSDLYSLGVIMFEALSGSLPFSMLDVGELLRAHASQPPPDLSILVPETPPELVQIVHTLLAKDPDDRYQDGQALAADLRDFIGKQRPAQRQEAPPMFGRQAELDELRHRWTRARTGVGGFAFVRSEHGLGKSRLVEEFGDLVEETGGTVLRARVLPGDTMPYAPFRDAFVSHLRQLARMPATERWERASRLRAVFDGWSPGQINRIAPGLDVVLRQDRDEPGRPDPAVEPNPVALPTGAVAMSVTEIAEQRGDDQFGTAIADALLELARTSGGLLLILDDVTAADASVRHVVGHLSQQIRNVPMLYLATGRDGELEQVLSDTELTAYIASAARVLDVDLRMGPLDESAIGAQIRSLLPGQHLPEDALAALVTRSNGNPFVAEEYLWAVLDAGLLWPAWGTWQIDLDHLDALDLPQDAMGLVLNRVQSLAPHALELLVTGAAMGAEVRVDVVAAVQQRSTASVHGVFAEAARQRLVEAGEDGTFRFLHGRIAEALLTGLGESELQALHYKIAGVLAARPAASQEMALARTFAVARHYIQAATAAPADKALAACAEAGRLALEESSAGEAITYLEYAVHLAPRRSPARSTLLVLLGQALKQGGQFAAARQRLEQALAVEEDPLNQGAIYTQLAEVHRSSYRSEELEDAIQKGFAATGKPLPRNTFWFLLSSALMALVSIPRRRLLGDVTGEARRRAQTMAGLHEAALFGATLGMRVSDFLAHNLRSLYWAAKLGHGRRFVAAQLNVGVLFAALSLNRAAERCFRRCDGDVSALNPQTRAMIRSFRLGGAWAGNRPEGGQWRGQFDDFSPHLDFAPLIDSISTFNLSACFAGRTTEAERWLAEGRVKLAERAEEITTFVTAAPMTAALQGRSTEAEREMRRLQEWAEDIDARQLRFISAMAGLFVLLEDGETGEPVDRAIETFEEMRLPPSLIWRAHRPMFYLVAAARLAQARACPGSPEGLREQARRTGQATKAVEMLGKAANTDELKAFYTIVKADLWVLQGQSRKALDTLNDLDVAGEDDMPTVAFESARVAARALTSLNRSEAERRARTAYAIATGERWSGRAEAVRAEFSLPREEHPSSTTGGSGRTTYTGGFDRERLAALQEVSAAASRVLDPRLLGRKALEEVIRILAAERAFLFLIDEETGALTPELGRDANGNDLSELTGYTTSLVDMVARTGKAQVVTGTEEGAALGAESVVLHGLRSILIAPLKLKEKMLGVIYLDSRVAKGIFSDTDLDILRALTGVVGSALETARAAERAIKAQAAEQAAQASAELANSLQRAGERIAAPVEKAAVLEQLVLSAGRDGGVLPADLALLLPNASVPVLDPESPFAGVAGDAPAEVREQLTDVSSWAAFPLRATDGDLGLLVLASADPQISLADSLAVGSTLVVQGMTAYDRASAFEQIRALAVVDELTQLNNRRRFFEIATRDLEAAQRQGRPLIGMMMDIDHFKRVNDTYGHPTGDDVIREVARRLAAQVRTTDVIGRYGGEEFAVLQQGDDPELELAERLRACVAESPIPTRTGPLEITISVGVAHLGPADADVAALLARADQGLYKAKQDGRNRVGFTSP